MQIKNHLVLVDDFLSYIYMILASISSKFYSL